MDCRFNPTSPVSYGMWFCPECEGSMYGDPTGKVPKRLHLRGCSGRVELYLFTRQEWERAQRDRPLSGPPADCALALKALSSPEDAGVLSVR